MANADELLPFFVRPECLKPELFLCNIQVSQHSYISMKAGETGADPKWDGRSVEWFKPFRGHRTLDALQGSGPDPGSWASLSLVSAAEVQRITNKQKKTS